MNTLTIALPAIYLLASLLAALLFTIDKRAARRGSWRVPESTLHLVELLGGWPGAFVASRVLRHKTVKPRYRVVFALCVVGNLCLLVLVLWRGVAA